MPDLVAAYQQHRDPRVGDKLLRAEDRWLRSQAARGARKYGLPFDDALQACRIGLLEAVERFDPQHGATLHAYAANGYIRKQLAQAAVEQNGPLTMPTGLHTPARLRDLHRAVATLRAEGAAVTDETIAAKTGWEVKSVAALRQAERLTSMDTPVDEDGEVLGNTLPDPTGLDGHHAVERKLDGEKVRAAVEEALAGLPPRRAEITRAWLSLGCSEGSMALVAQRLGVTRQAVSLAIGKGLEALADDVRLRGYL